MAYNREEAINYAPGGDSVKSGVEKLDADLTGAFTHLNTIQGDVDANQVVTDAHAAATAAHGATGAVVGTTNTQTLTNKAISLATNTVSGTLAQFNAAVSDADLASLAGSETLTNKTLTNPVVNGFTGDTSVINIGSGQIYKTATGEVLIGSTSSDGVNKLQVSGSASFTTNIYLNSTSGAFRLRTDAGVEKYNLRLSGDNLKFERGDGVEAMRLAYTTNNLLIGTTTDDSVNKLQVNGSIKSNYLSVVGYGGAYQSANKFGVDSYGNMARFYSSGSDSATLGGYDFHTHTEIGTLDSILMRLTPAGNLLIGTTTDDGVNRLQVNGSSSVTSVSKASYFQTTQTGGGIAQLVRTGVTQADAVSLELNSTYSDIVFKANGTARMWLDTTGNLIANVSATAPTLSTNSTMTFELTSNTQMKIKVRGTDGITRSTSLTLA